MPAAVNLFNHTTLKFIDGSFAPSHTYIINLYSAFSFNASSDTKAVAEIGATQLSTQYGYTQNSKQLANVSLTTVTTNDARWDCDDVIWTASGGSIGGAVGALIYDDSATSAPPVAYLDFGATQTATDGSEFKIIFSASGLFTFTVS